MAFAYQVKSDEQIEKEEKENSLFEPGTYGFEVLEYAKLGDHTLDTKDTKSKQGNDMMQLVLRVFNPEGRSNVIMDYLLDAMPRKLKNSAYACGLGHEYESKTLCAEKYIGRMGNLELVIQKGKKKDDGSGDSYPDRNSVKNYVLGSLPEPQKTDDFISDDIPF